MAKTTWTWMCTSDTGRGMDREVCDNKSFGFKTKKEAMDDYKNCSCHKRHNNSVIFAKRPLIKEVVFTFTKKNGRYFSIEKIEQPFNENRVSISFKNGDYDIEQKTVEVPDWGKKIENDAE